MQSKVQRILEAIETKQPLRVLLKKTNTKIVFATKDEQAHLFLSEEVIHTDYAEEGVFQVSVYGKKEWMEEVLNGTMSLRRLQALNKLTIKGNYRQILLVDTILLLCKKNELTTDK